jgi:hypothetical protein
MLRKTATPSMVNNSHPHSHQNVFSNQANPTKNKDAHGDVGQDKRAFTRARIASRQSARSHIPMRAQPTDNKTPRSQNTPVAKRRTVQLTLWTNPIVKAEIQRIAKREGVSDSAVGAAFLEKALQQNADLGIHVTRDRVASVRYSERLNSSKSSFSFQRTDRYGIVGQKHSHFQLDS